MRDDVRVSTPALRLAATGMLAAGVWVTAQAADWVTVAGAGFSALAVDRESIVVTDLSAHTVEAWFRYRFATAVDCSPPRGCFAASRRNRVYVDCYTGALALAEWQYLDLNDNVVAHASFSAPQFVIPREAIDRAGVNYTCGQYRMKYPGLTTTPPFQVDPYGGTTN